MTIRLKPFKKKDAKKISVETLPTDHLELRLISEKPKYDIQSALALMSIVVGSGIVIELLKLFFFSKK